MTSEHFATIRTLLMGLTGLACLAYALGALVLGRPDPVAWYWPALTGIAAAGLITLAAIGAGKVRAGRATDDLYRHTVRRAAAQGYWLSLAATALAGTLAAPGWIDWRTAFAVQGTLGGAAFLLAYVWHDLRLR